VGANTEWDLKNSLDLMLTGATVNTRYECYDEIYCDKVPENKTHIEKDKHARDTANNVHIINELKSLN